MEKGVGVGGSAESVTQELLHASKELCWLTIAKLFTTKELLQLLLL